MAVKLILTCRVEDHVSPLLKAISDAHFARPADLPPFPPNPVSIESGIGSGGPFVCMRPSRELLAWVYAVLAAGEQINAEPEVSAKAVSGDCACHSAVAYCPRTGCPRGLNK